VTARRGAHAWLALIAALTCLSCGGPGNTGYVAPNPDIAAAAPWSWGAVPLVDDAGVPQVPNEPVYPPIKTGQPDPGSGPADCSPLQAVDLAPAWMETFEPDPAGDSTFVGVATTWSSFVDTTKNAFIVPGVANWYPGLAGRFGAPWGLAADRINDGVSCDGKPNQWAMHLRGGMFREWGAGAVHVLSSIDAGCMTGAPADVCPAAPLPGATVDSAGLPLSPPGSADYEIPLVHTYWDLSRYEGIAFWARRGPEGQATMLLTIMDKFTSDDLARQNQLYCRRLKRCYTACANNGPCSLDEADPAGPTYRCFDPATTNLAPVTSTVQGVTSNPDLKDFLYPRCGPSACTNRPTYPDVEFEGKACRPYTFPPGQETGEFCFNKGDPPPPSKDERCLDGWSKTVWLTPDWKFYTIPFSELGQGSYGKPAPYFDLKSLYSVTFGFTVGWIDAYFDNVTFYRRKK
jgi:hypothetical protein